MHSQIGSKTQTPGWGMRGEKRGRREREGEDGRRRERREGKREGRGEGRGERERRGEEERGRETTDPGPLVKAK